MLRSARDQTRELGQLLIAQHGLIVDIHGLSTLGYVPRLDQLQRVLHLRVVRSSSQLALLEVISTTP